MRSQDNKILASMINSLESRVLSEIGELKDGHRAIQANHAVLLSSQATIIADVKAAKDVQITFRNELLGEGGRVSDLESRQKDHEFWQNVKIVLVLPIVGIIHKIGTVLGMKI